MSAEGYIEVTGGQIWYKIVGEGDGVPLLLLHGGPGFPSEYLDPLGALADERPVVFYDQLGCGRSDRPIDARLWRLDRFVEEVGRVREALSLSRVHILGQSWGTMLAVDYALTQPGGLVSLILASPALSIRRWTQDARRLPSELPEDSLATLDAHEREGFTSCPEYRAALIDFYRRYICRMRPSQASLERSFAGANQAVYQAMWGPTEFNVTGVLSTYERADRLPEITVPALFTCGRFDEATPDATAWYHSLLPGSKIRVFEKSAHQAHLEEPTQYVELVRAFLHQSEE